MYAAETCKKGEVQKEYTTKLNLIVCLHIWRIKRARHPLPTVFTSTVISSRDFHEAVPNTLQVFPGMADQGSELHSAVMLRPSSHGQNKSLRAELGQASDIGAALELYCFFELQQIKQIPTNTGCCPWSFLPEVSVITVTMGDVS